MSGHCSMSVFNQEFTAEGNMYIKKKNILRLTKMNL